MGDYNCGSESAVGEVRSAAAGRWVLGLNMTSIQDDKSPNWKSLFTARACAK